MTDTYDVLNTYDVGDLVRLSSAFVVSSVATDPTTVTLALRKPSGTALSYTYGAAQITKDSVGNYHKDISVDDTGVWAYKWTGTGTCETVEEGRFLVRLSKL